MSQTFSLICKKTRQRVWLGQGHDHKLESLYNNYDTYCNLKQFLINTQGRDLQFVCDDDHDEVFTYEEITNE